MANAYVSRFWVEEEISHELNVECEAARRAYSATMGGANETARAHDRYLKAVKHVHAFNEIRDERASA